MSQPDTTDLERLEDAKWLAHERECEQAAMAVINERKKIRKLRIFPVD